METMEPDNNPPKRRHVKKADANTSLALKRYHAHRTPEQRAAWRERVSQGTSVGMDRWHAQRTDAERERSRQLQTDAAVCRMWTSHQPGTKFKKGHGPLSNSTPEALARRSLAQIERASVKRILKDIVGVRPDLVREAIIEGLQAAPPRSFPYIALAAAYLDGKPIDASPPDERKEDLSELTRDQLLARALRIARRLQADAQQKPAHDIGGRELPVINIDSEASK